ncbi:MAG TPA: lytic transglycosylase domain-containing protein [Solirubrobacteraceae bacterium]|nr:lytic transglycosylase domain-containing protein [Solirubrobacteraceae bacterium]
MNAAARKRIARRRRIRRGALVLVAMAIVGVVVVLTAPIAKKAVKELTTLPLSHASIIRQQAADKHLSPALVAGVIYAETKFDARTSPAGAVGLMQIEPQTALFLAKRSGATTFTPSDLNTPSVNIAYGCYYLRYLLDEYHGSRVLALAAYNGGETNVNRWEAQAEAKGRALTISAIPFPETRDYVSRVLNAAEQYRHHYAHELGYE